MRSYIYSTVFLIAMAFVVLSCSDNDSNMNEHERHARNVMSESPGGGSGSDDYGRKRMEGKKKAVKIRKHLNSKYKGREEGSSVRTNHEDGSIERIGFTGDFTPPDYAKRANVDEDVRARSRAFLEEEKEIFGLIDMQNELKGGERVATTTNPRHPIRKDIRYYMEVEGLRVSGSTFFFVFTEDGEPIIMHADPKFVSPEARAAAKSFRTAGVTAEDVKEAVRADLVSRGQPQANIDRLKFIIEPGSFLVEEEPYVVWSLSVWYPEHGEDLGGWAYGFNAITGEMLGRSSTVHSEPGEW